MQRHFKNPIPPKPISARLIPFISQSLYIYLNGFHEALNHWDASKVSIVTTLIPVFTMIFSTIGHHLAPDYFAASDMNLVSYVGAMVVVTGALLAVAGEKVMEIFLRKI